VGYLGYDPGPAALALALARYCSRRRESPPSRSLGESRDSSTGEAVWEWVIVHGTVRANWRKDVQV